MLTNFWEKQIDDLTDQIRTKTRHVVVFSVLTDVEIANVGVIVMGDMVVAVVDGTLGSENVQPNQNCCVRVHWGLAHRSQPYSANFMGARDSYF